MRAQCPNLQGRDGMGQVIRGAGRAGEMEHVVDRPVDRDRLGDVVLDEAEARPFEQVGDVPAVAGQQVVDADDLVPLGEEPLAEVGADKPRPAVITVLAIPAPPLRPQSSGRGPPATSHHTINPPILATGGRVRARSDRDSASPRTPPIK